MTARVDVEAAVVGAGPYGLSAAAHLRRRGVDPLVVGEPMEGWLGSMPEGMFLKSVASGSSISAPEDGFGLADYCATLSRLPLPDVEPVPLDLFTGYGLWFQRERVPSVERSRVERIARVPDGFELAVGGRRLRARSVVVATGQVDYAYVPDLLGRLAPGGVSRDAPVSHSSQHRTFSGFAGRRVAVVGGGQSALESAALLHEAGAEVDVLVRAGSVAWGEPPGSFRLRTKPGSALGPGWSLYALDRLPGTVRLLPLALRLYLVREVLGPSGAFWLRPRVEGRVRVHTGWALEDARAAGDGVVLRRRGGGELAADHVIAATGYRVDLGALPFLAPELRAQLALAGGSPRLSSTFESSVPGLFFAGVTAAATFGPVMRFVCGTAFAGRRVAAGVAGRR